MMFMLTSDFADALCAHIAADTVLKSVDYTAISSASQLAEIATQSAGTPKAIVCQGYVDYDKRAMIRRISLGVIVFLELNYKKTSEHLAVIDQLAAKFQGGVSIGAIAVDLKRYYPIDTQKGRIVAFILELDAEEAATIQQGEPL